MAAGTEQIARTAEAAPAAPLTRGLTLALAAVCGLTAANQYYAQPLIEPIARSLGIDIAQAGLIVTLFQLGYVVGLVLLVPLGDLLESRGLIVRTLVGAALASAMAALAPSAPWFLLAALLVGIFTSAVQMIVPAASHLAPPEIRGRVMGTVISGLLVGILFARPAATLIGGTFGWRWVFGIGAVVMVFNAVLMARVLPVHRPPPGLSYRQLLGSMAGLVRDTPVLRQRAAYQATMFGAFSVFYTAIPLVLAAPPFSLGHGAIAAFMLSGAAGVFVAPYAGTLADRGHGRAGTGLAIALVLVGFGLAYLASGGSLALMVAAGIVLDAGVQVNFVISQRAIHMLPGEQRSRLNGLFLALFFFGGALGSALTGLAYMRGGWSSVLLLGTLFPLAAIGLFLCDRTRS